MLTTVVKAPPRGIAPAERRWLDDLWMVSASPAICPGEAALSTKQVACLVRP